MVVRSHLRWSNPVPRRPVAAVVIVQAAAAGVGGVGLVRVTIGVHAAALPKGRLADRDE